MLKNQCIVLAIYQYFSFGPSLETMNKKIINKEYAEDFSCLSHWEVRNPHPLYKMGRCWTSPFDQAKRDN